MQKNYINHAMQALIKIGFVLFISVYLFSCADNIPENLSTAKILDPKTTGYECYTIKNVGDKLSSGTVFYPSKTLNKGTDENCKPMIKAKPMEFSNRPVILLTHGFLSNKESLYYQAKYLAKMGVVAISYTTAQHSNPLATPSWWSDAYADMYRSFKLENSLKKSPIYNKLNLTNISLMGHSMGGGGLFYFYDNYPQLKFSAIIALAPHFHASDGQYAGKKLKAPVLILSGNSDWIAGANLQRNYYAQVPNSQIKALIELNKVEHSDYGSYGSDERHKIIDKYIQDWVKRFIYKMPLESTIYTKESLAKLKASEEIVAYKTNKLD